MNWIFDRLSKKLLTLGELVRNRDLFHIWAVQNIFQPRLLEEVLVRLTEQTENVIIILDNAEKSKCLNSGSDFSILLLMKIK